MEETMTAVATPSEQPMDSTQTPNAGEPADVPAGNTTIEPAEGEAAAAQPSSSGTPTGEGQTEPGDAETAEETDGALSEAPEAYTPIYNGEVVRVEASDTERVTTLLQKGLRFDHYEPMLADLRELAAAAEFKNPAELVRALLKNYEDSQYESMKRKGYDDADAKKLLETRRQERQEKLSQQDKQEEESQRKARQTLEERLAEQYADLKAEIPDVPAFDKLPKQVVTNAVQKGMSLVEAYLRFERAEQKRAQEAKNSEKAAAEASAGKLRGEPETSEDRAAAAMLRGLRQAL